MNEQQKDEVQDTNQGVQIIPSPFKNRLYLDWKSSGSVGSGCLAGDFRIVGDPEGGFAFEFLDLESGQYRACLHSAELAVCFTAFLCDLAGEANKWKST